MRTVLHFAGDDLANEGGLRAVVDGDVGKSTCEAGVAVEHDDAVTFRTADELCRWVES